MPNNVVYLYFGLAVVIGLMSVYVLSLVLRFRRATSARKKIQDLRE